MHFGFLLASDCFSRNSNSHNQYLKDEKASCPLGYILSGMLYFIPLNPSECLLAFLSEDSSLL